MIGMYNRMSLYNAEKNVFLKNAKDLVPRIVTYGRDFAFCLIEKHGFTNPYYYCFLSKFGFSDTDVYCHGDVIKKLSLEDYFKISYRLKGLGLKFNLKKIIYDSNRNK